MLFLSCCGSNIYLQNMGDLVLTYSGKNIKCIPESFGASAFKKISFGATQI